MWTQPTVADFKAFFFRDFNYAPSSDPSNLKHVIDADITKAINQALLNFNEDLFGSDDQVTMVFMYLAAFYLVYDIQTSAQGLSSQSNFQISSKSVGGVAVSYSIPDKFSRDPALAIYAQNGYGLKYLSMAIPMIIGNVQVVEGTTTFD